MTFQPDLFKGRAALVSGGTQGIGAAVVAELAGLGAEVIAAGLPAADGAPTPPGVRRGTRWSAAWTGWTSWSTAPG